MIIRTEFAPSPVEAPRESFKSGPYLGPDGMKILVCVAWPYAAGPRHLGHAVSTFIPADIVARYHRMKGDQVLLVGGTDMHGTPTLFLADQEGGTRRAVAERSHAIHE